MKRLSFPISLMEFSLTKSLCVLCFANHRSYWIVACARLKFIKPFLQHPCSEKMVQIGRIFTLYVFIRKAKSLFQKIKRQNILTKRIKIYFKKIKR
ncbi:hypothetical protein HMPREF1423_00856 [Helicobacter pylori GAM270ASi]|nr:hypothetical protein HMPREF1423_00856 [Helicobacter pylori GAM270ASi]